MPVSIHLFRKSRRASGIYPVYKIKCLLSLSRSFTRSASMSVQIQCPIKRLQRQLGCVHVTPCSCSNRFHQSFQPRQRPAPSGLTGRIFKSPRDEAPHGALISIGSKTDSVLDELNLPDQIIPHLRYLIRFKRSQNWASELENDTWGFSSQEATCLAKAMIGDTGSYRYPEVRLYYPM
jgi:hypothetical protein